MSKAFTKESTSVERLGRAPASASLPPGTKNYLTPDGAARFREELQRLTDQVRPQLANARNSPEKLEQLAAIDEEIRLLSAILASAVVPSPPPPGENKVRFGATVNVRSDKGEESTYRIVGVDEVDLDRNWVSWRSPLANALLNRSLGEAINFKFPAGTQTLTVIGITYTNE
ncbi:MAG TPA: GreA/GreB family elongation factor [Methylomirabilota bacterium]|nr:GreA/GreB family elongation factor [Methylomirabilota bacterium]